MGTLPVEGALSPRVVLVFSVGRHGSAWHSRLHRRVQGRGRARQGRATETGNDSAFRFLQMRPVQAWFSIGCSGKLSGIVDVEVKLGHDTVAIHGGRLSTSSLITLP